MLNRKNKATKIVACFLAINLILQIAAPTAAFALTSGPSQPEVQSFEPAGTTQMVDLFSGDFTYNLPLFELPGPDGGYPFNLSYHSGVGMDQEASWVGLGWNINPGAINRSKRGLPDEFKGDLVKVKQDIKPSHTVGINAGANLEIFGGDMGLNLGLNMYWNNYRGMGFGASAAVSPGEDVNIGPAVGVNIGLGWLARLIKEPKRLWRRNFVSSPMFLWDLRKTKIVKN